MKTQEGLEVSTTSVDVINNLDHFYHQILGSGKEAGTILNAVERYPSNILLLSYAAAFNLYAQEHAATEVANDYLVQAESLFRSANLREKLTFQAIKAWSNLEYETALTFFAAIIELFPQDLLALKFAEWLYYCTGQAFQAEQFLALCYRCFKPNENNPYFLASFSFALELSGHYQEAKASAEKAISLERNTPWAHHSLAHVYLLQSDIEGGIKVLKDLQPTWEGILPLLRGHNSWHLALFHLANRDESQVMNLYPKIFGSLPNTALEQLDAISLLWRMDMAGISQEQRFRDILPHLGLHPFEQYIGFNNAHFIYCLARAGEEELLKRSLADASDYANKLPPGYKRDLWQKTASPLLAGIAAFAKGDYSLAADLMATSFPYAFQMGGSDAQNELFTQSYFLSLLRSGQTKRAREFFNHWLSHYQNSALADYWFSKSI
nr:tetratricopeptide repeat protein [Legionella jordanis]